MAKSKKSNNTCNWCGYSYSDCKCKSWYILKGILLILFGILLWTGIWNLELTIAVILILIGLKKLTMCCYRR